MLCCHQAGKWSPRQPDQQAATQCSLDPTEMWANAFSKWPLLLYLITERSVNLKLMLVCHGEAHLARVWELPAAGCLSVVPHLEPCAPLGVGARQRQLSWQWLENIVCFCPAFSFSMSQTVSVFLRGESFFLFFFNGFWHFDRHNPVMSSAMVAVAVAVL